MTTPLKELVAEVELLSAQATEGPWYEEAASGDRNLITAIKSGDVGVTDKWVDAVFIAALRTAWPDVVRGIDSLRAEVDGTNEAFAAVVEKKQEAERKAAILESSQRIILDQRDKAVRERNLLLERIREIAEVPCSTRHGRTPMRCFPRDKCTFCRCRDLLDQLGGG